ncbi:MAG: hypothetical protein MHPSP_003041, partial [Paramarteilia canceri]
IILIAIVVLASIIVLLSLSIICSCYCSICRRTTQSQFCCTHKKNNQKKKNDSIRDSTNSYNSQNPNHYYERKEENFISSTADDFPNSNDEEREITLKKNNYEIDEFSQSLSSHQSQKYHLNQAGENFINTNGVREQSSNDQNKEFDVNMNYKQNMSKPFESNNNSILEPFYLEKTSKNSAFFITESKHF